MSQKQIIKQKLLLQCQKFFRGAYYVGYSNCVSCGWYGLRIGQSLHHKQKVLLPRKSKLAFHPGFLGEMFVGSIASLVGVAMFNPETMMEILKVSILAGVSGQAFLLHNRLATEQVKSNEIQSISKKLTELEKRIRNERGVIWYKQKQRDEEIWLCNGQIQRVELR